MPIEVANYVAQLVSSNPQGLDDFANGDDHIRLIKSVLQSTFPDADKAIYLRNKVANKTAGYAVTLEDNGKLITVDATAGPVAIVLPAIAAAGDGFNITVMKIDASANAVDIVPSGSETINGAALWPFTDRFDSAKVWSDGAGSDWKGIGVAIGSITSGKIAPLAVTVSRIGDGAVSTAKIEDLAVTAAKIAALTITAAQIADGTITQAKLAAGVGGLNDMLVYSDQKSNGTVGNTYGGGSWVVVPLNTEVMDTAGIGTLASNQVSLPVGKYEVHAKVMPGRADGANVQYRIRLRDTTNNVTLVTGVNTLQPGVGFNGPAATLDGGFTLADTANVRLELWCSSALGTGMLGVSTGDVEEWGKLQLRRYSST